MARRSKQDRDALNAARRKKAERYWNDRAQSRVRANDRDGDRMKTEQEKAYRTVRDKVRQEIDKFYRDFGNAAGMSAEEARQKLSRGELRDFKAELERKRAIIQKMMRKDPNNKALKKYDTEWMRLSKVRELTRKEALEANITAEIAQLGGKQQRSFDAHANQVIHTSLKMNADDLKKLGDVDVKLGVGSPEQVMRAARENWQHSDFSDRIWADKDKLIKEAREVIEEGFARNKGAMDMVTDLMTRMNVSHSNALRLVRTEFNHLSNQAALAEYKANGVKKYKFVAAIDNRTCSVCHELNDKVFNVAEARVGINFPPIHPNCRSVTVPVIDWGDDDKWDYSKIELDDDELAALGLTDDDVKSLDATSPKLANDAPAPTLSVHDANRAAADTQSVVRRAELTEKLGNQVLALDADMHRELERLDKVNDELKRLENLNQRMEAQGAAMTETRAAIEAERLEQASLDLRERELEVAKLQARAAKLDPTVPKPDRDEIDAKTAQIEADKAKRESRRAKDLSNAEIIAQATPSPFPLAPQTAEDAVAPKTAIGKLWARVKREVEEGKAHITDDVEYFGQRVNDWLVKNRHKRDVMRILPVLLNVSMADPADELPKLSRKQRRAASVLVQAAQRVPKHGLAQNDLGHNIGLKSDGAKPVWKIAEKLEIPENKRSHIFTKRHFGEIPPEIAEKKLLEIVRDARNYLGTSGFYAHANDWYVETDEKGGQWWIKIDMSGHIEDAGYNPSGDTRGWDNHFGMVKS